MALSGYLFAKILNGKRIIFTDFVYNRILRLLPLLIVVIILAGFRRVGNGEKLADYSISVLKGVIFPTLPNGGWSITVEFHFYLLIPLLLWLIRKSKYLLFVVLLLAIGINFLLIEQFLVELINSYWE